MTRNSLISLVIALLLFAVSLVAYGMWYGAVSALSLHAASLAADITAKHNDVARIAEAKTALATLANEETTIRQYFVSTTDVVSFLEELQATGKSFGTKLDVVSVSSDDTGAVPHLTLALKIEGSFDAVMRTLGALEYAPRDIVVNDMALGISGKANWVANGTFTVGTRKADAKKAAPVLQVSTTTAESNTP